MHNEKHGRCQSGCATTHVTLRAPTCTSGIQAPQYGGCSTSAAAVLGCLQRCERDRSGDARWMPHAFLNRAVEALHPRWGGTQTPAISPTRRTHTADARWRRRAQRAGRTLLAEVDDMIIADPNVRDVPIGGLAELLRTAFVASCGACQVPPHAGLRALARERGRGATVCG